MGDGRLSEAITPLPMAVEPREGYDRDAFSHRNADGCNTRAEVLIAEAGEPPRGRCQ